MPAKASQEERMLLLYRLDGEVVDLPYMADACDEPDNLAERDPSPVTAVPDDCSEGAAVLGVRTERNLSQRR
jgi:hypothetical protein